MSNPEYNVEEIAAFLKANPDFFTAYPDALLDINLPHPHGGRAVSIPERQLIATREKVRLLENKLAELIEFGTENDKLSDKVHALTLKLIACQTFDQTIDTLYLDLLDNFQVPHVAVRLWNVVAPPASASAPEFQTVPTELQQFVEAMTNPYCGGHPVYETHLWFGEHAPHLKSYAMLPLKGEHTMGLLLLASESAERFYADMGTLFLTRIGELLAQCLARQLTAAPPAAPISAAPPA